MATVTQQHPTFEVCIPAVVADIPVPKLSWMDNDYALHVVGTVEDTRTYTIDRRMSTRMSDRRHTPSTYTRTKLRFTQVKAVVDGVSLGYVNVRI